MKLLELGLLAGAAYLFLSRTATAAPSQAASGSTNLTPDWKTGNKDGRSVATPPPHGLGALSPSDQVNQYIKAAAIEDGRLSSPIVVGGRIIGTDIYKGRLSIDQNAHIANIQARYGGNTSITPTNNPLTLNVGLVGGSTIRSTRRPSNDSERQAARAANIADLASRGVTVHTKESIYG